MNERYDNYEVMSDRERYLDKDGVERVYTAFLEKFDPQKVSWVNPPEIKGSAEEGYTFWHDGKEISAEQSQAVWERKLNGAYSERLANFMNGLAAIVDNGYNVELVQFQKEKGTPFDASGWLVVVLETMPIFHLAPGDLAAEDLAEIVNVYIDNQDPSVCWKQTDKRGENIALKTAIDEPGKDLVAIAKRYSSL